MDSPNKATKRPHLIAGREFWPGLAYQGKRSPKVIRTFDGDGMWGRGWVAYINSDGGRENITAHAFARWAGDEVQT